jgi:hypothetical protein
MAFTTGDFEALLRLLEEQPESRAQLRLLLFADGLGTLPERFDRLTEVLERLAEAQSRTEARLEQLAEAQSRTEVRLEQLAEAQARTETRLERLEATVQALAEAQARTETRLERLEATVQALAEAQSRTEVRLKQLAAAQSRTEARLERLAEAQERTAEQLAELVSWQAGEAGRRAGERYERRIARRGWTLFQGGQGGAPDQPSVQQRLSAILEALPATDLLADEEADPFLADLIWWKDGQFLVVEASLKVNGSDVIRAARRAETLERANVRATPVVVGQEWGEPGARQQAEARGVHWWVGDELSDGLVAFRRLTS